MDKYRTEEEQVEALRRWWQENGRSIVIAVAVALALSFGWQSYKSSRQHGAEAASDLYQSLLQSLEQQTDDSASQLQALAEQLKTEHSGTTYAQFAALHLAAQAVERNDLIEAQAQLRWVLAKADKGSDTAQLAQLRLGRVLAAAGDTDQALAVLSEQAAGDYGTAYAVARGNVLLAAGRRDEAREAFASAQARLESAGVDAANLPILRAKLQTLSPAAPSAVMSDSGQADAPQASEGQPSETPASESPASGDAPTVQED